MKRASWMIGSLTALALAACGGGSNAGNAGAGTETGSPGMAADTAPGSSGRQYEESEILIDQRRSGLLIISLVRHIVS